jgi:hypothetical protein
VFLNQRGAEFSFFYTKRSSSTHTFKLTGSYTKIEDSAVDFQHDDRRFEARIRACSHSR